VFEAEADGPAAMGSQGATESASVTKPEPKKPVLKKPKPTLDQVSSRDRREEEVGPTQAPPPARQERPATQGPPRELLREAAPAPAAACSVKDRAKDRAKARVASSAGASSPASEAHSPSPASSMASPPSSSNASPEQVSYDRSNEKRYLSDRARVVTADGVLPGPFPMEGVDRPLSAAYLEDLETALLSNAQRAYNSCERAESLILQLKATSCASAEQLGRRPMGNLMGGYK